MNEIGYQSLILSLVLIGYSTVLFFIAGRKKSFILFQSAQHAVYAVFLLVSIASAALLYAFYTRDFRVEYVANYSNRSLSWFYTTASFWAGQDGSLLLWAWLLSLFSVIVIKQNKNKNSLLLPYTMGIMSFTTLFFLYLLVVKTNPFATFSFTPADGKGLNPLLQNPEMIFHPPSLYIGFVGFTVPFAFAIAALMNNRLDEQWIKSIRRWTLFSWLFLTIGNILGMQWAYVELGWGGYWAWDPVENSSLLPWLTGSAFLHSVIVQERKGMLKKWNITLIVLTFALTIFGTFVTRSGLISSVHAFGVSDLGPLFLGFLALILIVSFTLLYRRADSLTNDRNIISWSSKESSFLLNNILFSALTLGVFWGTIMPAISEVFTGKKVTVGEHFFNQMATPIGLVIFLLIGICTLLAWNKTTVKKLYKNLLIPGVVTVVLFVLFILSGIRNTTALIALSIFVFSLGVTLLEFARGISARKRMDNSSFAKAIVNLLRINKRRYGGFIVHLGVLMLFLGMIGSSAFGLEKTATIHKGGNIEVGRFSLLYKGLTSEHTGDLNIVSANFDIYNNKKFVGPISSEKHFHENFQPATEVGIRSTLKEDLYVILSGYDNKTDTATVSVLINPLVLWMWIGGIVMVVGTILAMTPRIFNKN
ncbi:heme lyase CcmF/NrfE family subunit [candidate division KSB1 bacterium]|nr:heme lyase CcmF/NrfE family subunit [candidate division KSB1 bacterium]